MIIATGRTFESLPNDQGGHGRHKCAGCAYEKGFQDGFNRRESMELNLDSLPNSQAGIFSVLLYDLI